MEDNFVDFTISINNINQALKVLAYQSDFTFVFHKQKFETYRLVADLLSPAIAQIHRSDPTYDTYIFNNNDPKADLFDFTKILQMVDNNTYTIKTTDELQIFKDIFFELKNENVLALFHTFKSEISINNVFERIEIKQSMDINADINEEIDFIAKKFNDLRKKDEIMSLSLDVIESILFSEHLILSSEDDVFYFITSYSIEKSLILEEDSSNIDNDSAFPLSEIGIGLEYNFNFLDEKLQNRKLSDIMIKKEVFDNCFITLLDSVIISNLSENALTIFLGLYNFHEMTNNIWEKVAMKILNIPINYQNKQKSRYSYIKEDNLIEGIFEPITPQNDDTEENFLQIIPFNNNHAATADLLGIF